MTINRHAFLMALKHTLSYEGGESNHPLDPGGQTIYGISRRYWPGWIGWEFVDNGEGVPSFCVEEFYRINFWDKVQGDELAYVFQDLSCEVFDTSVNISVGSGSKLLQQALNLLNRNQKSYPDIKEDGKIGLITLNTVTKCATHGRVRPLVKLLNHLQAEHYIKLMRRNPANEEFYGWFKRT